MTGVRSPRRDALPMAIVVVALAGVAVDIAVDGVRHWLYTHAFTNAVLVGVLLIAATYLVVERTLEARDRERWSEAAGPLLDAIAVAGAATDRELRTGGAAAAASCDWLAQLLERYQSQLTGTPELMAHWHAALSLAQHARAALAARPAPPDAAYGAAWSRFELTFADVHDFAGAAPSSSGATWRLPVVHP
jgi:hypothetical protein